MLKRALATVATALLIAGCSGGASNTLAPAAQQGGGSKMQPPVSGQARFRAATAADKAADRPSLRTARSGAFTPMDGRHDHAHYKLVTSLQIDDQGNFSEWTSQCDKSLWDAPWYWADSTFSLPVASSTVLAVCTKGEGDDGGMHSMARPGITPTPSPTPVPTATPSPTPTPVPTATPTVTDLYIVKLDIGWWDVTVTPISGPATEAGGNWTFPASTTSDDFQDGHLYAFFVAKKRGDDDGGGHHHDH